MSVYSLSFWRMAIRQNAMGATSMKILDRENLSELG
jgi:hypothetical protein